MRIVRLRLVNFRRFADVELSFTPGMNLIRGPNESGKSTVVRALSAALFDKPGASSARSKLDARWGAGELPWLELVFTDVDREYRLVKDFEARKVMLEQPGGARTLGSSKAVDAKIAELLGFRDPGQYLRTACVTHDQMISLGEDGGSAKKLAGMLREVVIGSRESGQVERAVRELSREIDELKRGLERPTNNPGTIRRLQDEREMYIARQKDLSVGAGDTAEQSERLAEIERLIDEKAVRLSDLSGIIEKNRALAEAEKRYDEARARFDDADRTQEAATRLERLQGRIEKSFPGFDELDPRCDVELRKALEVRESLEALMDELSSGEGPEPQGDAETPAPAPRPRERLRGLACAAAGIVLVVLGVVLGAAVHPALYALAAPGLPALGFGGYLLASHRRGAPRAAGQEPEAGEGEPEPGAKPLEESLARARSQLDRIDAREREFLESAGYETADEFLARFAEYGEMLEERNEAAAGLKALLAGRGREEVEADRRKAAVMVSVCDEKLAELAGFKLPPEGLEAAVRERTALASELDALESERDGLSFHLAKTASDPEEAIKIEEVVSWLWEAEQSARRRLRVSTMARDAMLEASEEMLSAAVPVLARSVAETFSRLTGGRYDDVEVRESDLAISVYSAEKGEMIGADELLSTLSKGTASQLYLSARLQLADMLSGGRRPPLIFDDSFSYFDERRLEALWSVLEETAAGRQVLLFTCTDRYDELAAGTNIIDLPFA